MDRITAGHLKSFVDSEALGSEPEDVQFEHFTNYCVLSGYHSGEFDLRAVHTGGGNDLGIDGLAIVVNGVHVTSPSEVQDLIDVNGYIEVEMFFVQAKRSSKFSVKEIGNFGEGVEDFFAEDLDVKPNEAIADGRELMEAIYDSSSAFRGKPRCRLFFATTGEWKPGDLNLEKRMEKICSRLQNTSLFGEVILTPVDRHGLNGLYTRALNPVEATVVMQDTILLPEIPNVDSSYLGVLPGSEFLKLIQDENGAMRRSIFEDNVRDYQGNKNKVNQEIGKTLADGGRRSRFCVLNNGVTIVARSVEVTRNKFQLTDYQIVNGCQTSHVVFEHRYDLEGVEVPIKIIITEDEAIISNVVSATNRQTAVTDDDLFSSTEIHRLLEAHFPTHEGVRKLFFERRNRQYVSNRSVEEVRIVTRKQVARSFAALYQDDPHRASRYYSAIEAQFGKDIYAPSHKLEPYYSCAFAY